MNRPGSRTEHLPVSFSKMAGGGNDFVVIDNRQGEVTDPGPLAERICTRRLSVGADGLILVERSSVADFRMLYYNADGSRADFCANGTRCVARFASLERVVTSSEMKIETDAGIVPAHVEGEAVTLLVPSPADYRSNPLEALGRTFDGSSILVGVPHYVIFVDELWSMDVVEPGRALRNHPALQPAGANVNFVSVATSNRIEVRTYERGVEEETLSCGSGVVASVAVSALMKKVSTPVEVLTRSGIVLRVSFEESESTPRRLHSVTLSGDARVVYRSALTDDTLRGFDPKWVRHPTSS